MKRLLAVLLFSGLAFAQGGSIDGTALTSTGGLAGGASVRVCTSAASGTPCSPLASIYTGSTLAVPKANPLTADTLGYYYWFAAPGCYKEQTTYGGATVERTVCIGVVAGSSPSFGTVTATTAVNSPSYLKNGVALASTDLSDTASISRLGPSISNAELDQSECADGEIKKKVTGAWACAADNAGSAGPKTLTFRIGSDAATAVVADTDDESGIWVNDLGATYRVTRVWVQSDGGTPSINIQRDDGSAANVLSGALVGATGNGACADSSGGTMTVHGGTITCSNTIQAGERDFAVGDGLNVLVVTAGGVAKRITVQLRLEPQ